jgi:hypothetical protein
VEKYKAFETIKEECRSVITNNGFKILCHCQVSLLCCRNNYYLRKSKPAILPLFLIVEGRQLRNFPANRESAGMRTLQRLCGPRFAVGPG